MIKWIIIALLIVMIPIVLWNLICSALISYGEQEQKAADEKIKAVEPRKQFTATVVSTEILNVWSVLMCTADDGSEGFYLKTTDRSIKAGTVLPIVQLNDFPGMEELLRHCQVKPDEEFRNRITGMDHRRILDKLMSERDGAVYFIRLGYWLRKIGMSVVTPVCILAAAALIIWKHNH